MKKISNKSHQGALILKFCRHSIITWKSWPNVFKFQQMSIFAIYIATGNSLTANANKNLQKYILKSSWYCHLRDRASCTLYTGVWIFTEVGYVWNWVFLNLHNWHYFSPFLSEQRQARSKRGVSDAHDGGRHRKKIIIFSVPFPVVCVSGILACFVLALAHLKNANN